MARAVVPNFALGPIGNLPDIRDDVTNGWIARFQVVYTGTGASGGFMRDEFEVHFQDVETVVVQNNKIRDAARARATELNIPNAGSMVVTSFIQLSRL